MVRRLEEELADPEIAAEAKWILRTLIKTIKVTPGAKRGEVALELHGELAAILFAGRLGKKSKDGSPVSRNQVSVVAGARNHLDLQLAALLNTTCVPAALSAREMPCRRVRTMCSRQE
jgi:hypothetical protein